MQLVFSDRYVVDIGEHVLHTGTYGQLRDALVARGLAGPGALVEPQPAAWEDLSLVHDAEYLDRARTGRFDASGLARLELPWTAAGVDASRLMVGGTILAGRIARDAAVPAVTPASPRLAASANLGGGLHHAFPSHGEGFCLFNDLAVAIRVLQREGTIRHAAVIDTDVHQGNGTAFIFRGDPSVFTCSIFQEQNYPSPKVQGSLDIGLRDGAGDEEYLQAVERALPAVVASRPDLLFYVAGADPYAGDQLGGLRLTFEGLRGRDYMVLTAARDAGVPVAIVLAGGYARRPDDTVAIHAATIEEAARLGA